MADKVSKQQFTEDVTRLEHLARDTVSKLRGNALNPAFREQTGAYLHSLLGAILHIRDTYYGGPLTEGAYRRMILGEWTDVP